MTLVQGAISAPVQMESEELAPLFQQGIQDFLPEPEPQPEKEVFFPEHLFLEEKQQELEVTDFVAHIRVINKKTDKIDSYHLQPGMQIFHGPLMLEVRNCLPDYNNLPENDVAWVDVQDHEGNALFGGWMYRAYPGISALNDATYDLRLLSCKIRKS